MSFADTPNSWRTIVLWPAVCAPLKVLVLRWQIQLPLPWGVTTRTSVVLHGPLMQINAKAIAYSWAECARKPAASAIRKSRTGMIITQKRAWEVQWPQISRLRIFGKMAFSAYFLLLFTLIFKSNCVFRISKCFIDFYYTSIVLMINAHSILHYWLGWPANCLVTLFDRKIQIFKTS